MNLVKYIELVGDKLIMDITGVSRQTVHNWKNLKSIPAPHNAAALIMASNGVLNWDNVYEPYFSLES